MDELYHLFNYMASQMSYSCAKTRMHNMSVGLFRWRNNCFKVFYWYNKKKLFLHQRACSPKQVIAIYFCGATVRPAAGRAEVMRLLNGCREISTRTLPAKWSAWGWIGYFLGCAASFLLQFFFYIGGTLNCNLTSWSLKPRVCPLCNNKKPSVSCFQMPFDFLT